MRRFQQQVGLTAQQEARFREFAGTRTINASLQDIHAFVQPILGDRTELFEEDDIDCCAPCLTDSEYGHAIENVAMHIRQDLASTPGLADATGLQVLDIGCGRGFSTAAFFRLGHDALGVDYDYDDDNTSMSALMRRRVGRLLSREEMFVNADMTDCPELPDDSRDLIYSTSCLEHIQDIAAACREMYRVLRSGGRMLHRYNPFWAENGGHALGILDAPWLHAVLSRQDFERYLIEHRGHEAEISLPWTRAGLNRRITISAMQRALSEAGFRIESWKETIRSPDDLSRLAPDILAKVQKRYPDVQLADLLATDIVFSAVKPPE